MNITNTSIPGQNITFIEFKMWLQGLIEGKNGELPDIEDWKRIKEMMDRVVPEVQRIVSPTPADHYWYPPHPYVSPSWITPDTIPCKTTITCGSNEYTYTINMMTALQTGLGLKGKKNG